MRYDAVNTKIAAMRGNLFTRADYENMCRQESVEGVGAMLRDNPGYRSALTERDELHRGMAEQRIQLAYYLVDGQVGIRGQGAAFALRAAQTVGELRDVTLQPYQLLGEPIRSQRPLVLPAGGGDLPDLKGKNL